MVIVARHGGGSLIVPLGGGHPPLGVLSAQAPCRGWLEQGGPRGGDDVIGHAAHLKGVDEALFAGGDAASPHTGPGLPMEARGSRHLSRTVKYWPKLHPVRIHGRKYNV